MSKDKEAKFLSFLLNLQLSKKMNHNHVDICNRYTFRTLLRLTFISIQQETALQQIFDNLAIYFKMHRHKFARHIIFQPIF